MGSKFFGDLNLGNERSSSTNNSSKKAKKSSSSDTPKQPQRGLGVAQLEKIRLHSQMGASTYLPPSNHHLPFPSSVTQEDPSRKTSYAPSFSYSSSSVHQQSFMMGLSDMGNIGYPDPEHQSTPTSRWNHGSNVIIESQYLRQASIIPHFLNHQEQDLLEMRRNEDKIDFMGSSSHKESSGNQELDLELRLSL